MRNAQIDWKSLPIVFHSECNHSTVEVRAHPYLVLAGFSEGVFWRT